MNIDSLKVDELKNELKKRGCTPAEMRGVKKDLVARLSALIAQESNGDNNQTENNSPPESVTEIPSEETAAIDPNSPIEVVASKPVDEKSSPIKDVKAKEEVIDTEPELNSESTPKIVDKVSPDKKNKAEKILELKEKAKIVAREAEAIKLGDLNSIPPVESQTTTLSDPSCNVRIDNFVRPLNQKVLLQWIQDKMNKNQVDVSLVPEDLWVNSIKTHCYVTFPSPKEALACINIIQGCRWPESSNINDNNSGILEADFTTVDSRSAESSAEAKLRPGEWKNVKTQASITSESSFLNEKEDQIIVSTASPPTNNNNHSSSAVSSQHRGRNSSNLAVGALMKAVAASTRNTNLSTMGSGSDNSTSAAHSSLNIKVPQGGRLVGLLGVKRDRSDRSERDRETLSHHPSDSSKHQRSSKSLDDLFNKTESSPSLYWLPLTEEEAEEKNARLIYQKDNTCYPFRDNGSCPRGYQCRFNHYMIEKALIVSS